MNKKIMTEEEMNNFIESVGRVELFDELEFIRKKEYFNPTNLIGRDSCYLKAIRVALVTLGYDEKWAYSIFADALEARYPIKSSNKSKGE